MHYSMNILESHACCMNESCMYTFAICSLHPVTGAHFAPIHNLSGACPTPISPWCAWCAKFWLGNHGDNLHQVIHIVGNYPLPSTRDFQAFGSQKVSDYILNIRITPSVMVNSIHPQLAKFFWNISLGWGDLLHHVGVEKGSSFGKGSSISPQWLWSTAGTTDLNHENPITD